MKPMADTELLHTAKNAGIIGLAAAAGSLIGFALQVVMSAQFGASAATDAYVMAQRTSELLSKLLLGGSITAVFLPIFVEKLTRNRTDAWDTALNVFHLTAAAFLAVIGVLFTFAHQFIGFIAPGYDAPTTALTVSLLRILLPSFALLFLGELATSMLHALRNFWVPALLRVISPAITITALITLTQTLGIFALAIGAVVSATVQFAYLAWHLHRSGLSYRFVFTPRDPTVRRIIVLVSPFILSVIATQAAGIVYRRLVSDLSTGSFSALHYAEKITQQLQDIFLKSITLVIFPTLSYKAARFDLPGMRHSMAGALRLIAFVTLPVVTGVALLHKEITAVAYQRGNFDAQDAALTSTALFFLVLGIATNGLSSLFGHATLALQKTRASVAVTIASQGVAIGLFVLLVPRLAHAGLALASSLVPISAALLYFIYLSRAVPQLWRIFLHRTLAKTTALTALMGITVSAVAAAIHRLPLPPRAADVTVLATGIPLGAGLFFALAYAWRIAEVREVTAMMHDRLSRWRTARASTSKAAVHDSLTADHDAPFL